MCCGARLRARSSRLPPPLWLVLIVSALARSVSGVPLGNSTYLTVSPSPPPAITPPPPLAFRAWRGGSLLEVSSSSSFLGFVDSLPPPDLLSLSHDGSPYCPPVPPRSGGGPRGVVRYLSPASRRRLSADLARVLRSAPMLFLSLTMPGDPSRWSGSFSPDFGPPRPLPGPFESRHLLRVWFKRVLRHCPTVSAHWKLEPQMRGVPHFHLLMYGFPTDPDSLDAFIVWMRDQWHDVAGRGDPLHLLHGFDAQPVIDNPDLARSYLAKYVSKDGPLELNPDIGAFIPPDPSSVGRFWGVMGRERIPYARPVSVPVPEIVRVMLLRITRRLQRAKIRRSHDARVRRFLSQRLGSLVDSDPAFIRGRSTDLAKLSRILASHHGGEPAPKFSDPFRRVGHLRYTYTRDPVRFLDDLFRAGEIWGRSHRPPPWFRVARLAGPVGTLP